MFEEYLKHVNMNVSEKIKDFVKEGVFGESEYLFIKNDNGVNKAYCSKCGKEFETEHIKHNEVGICPVCGAKVEVKSLRYGRKKCKNEACFYYFEKSVVDPNMVVCKGYYVSKDYEVDYKNPKIEYELYAIYIFENKKAHMLKRNWWRGRYELRSSIFDFDQGWLAPMMCYCSFESIGEAIKDTYFQYMPYKMFEGHYSMVKLFNEYCKYPWIEQLCKIGFSSIIKDKLEGKHIYNCLNYRGKNVFKILRLSRKDVKDIRTSNIEITPLFLSIYQMQVKDNSRLSPVECKKIKDTFGGHFAHLVNVLKHTNMRKAVKYINKQYRKYEKSNNYFYYKSNVVVTWSDYISDCIKLEMDLTCENMLFPKNVYTAHQNTIAQVKIKASEYLNSRIRKRLNSLEKYKFEYNNLIIRAAESSNELIKEGEILHHCVGGYAEKYASGKTNIFVIRKEDKLNIPYYTLELGKNNEIIQIHGKNNCSPNKEVKQFIEEFKAEKLNRKVAKNRISISA